MIIQIDTREHEGERKRIEQQLTKLGVKFIHSKLYVGDYMSLDNAKLVIDRKKNLQELCGNVAQQHERFVNELKKALDAEIKVIILVEHSNSIKSLEDIKYWDNPRRHIKTTKLINGVSCRVNKYPKAITGKTLFKTLCTLHERYKVDYAFCSEDETGGKIVQILSGEWKTTEDG